MMMGMSTASELPRMPVRSASAHKGDAGRVVVVGGNVSAGGMMLGAPALSALGAMRAGCGLCTIVAPSRVLAGALGLCPSATGAELPVDDAGDVIPHEAAAVLDRVLEHASCAVIGPGLGQSFGAASMVLRAIQQEQVPIVLDADGLNAISTEPEGYRELRAAAVLTPHPGEFKRLCAAMGLTNNLGLAADRAQACMSMAQRLGRIVVLKGAGTVVSDGLNTWTCPAGHPCLATGGTGDVLAGVIAGLIAQFCPSGQEMLMRARVPQMPQNPARPLSLFHAACLGVLAHAQAGERWSTQNRASTGLLAHELPALIPGVIESLR